MTVEFEEGGQLGPVKRKSSLFLIWVQFASLVLNCIYGALLFLSYNRIQEIDRLFMVNFRNFLVIFLVVTIGSAMILNKRENPKKDERKPRNAWKIFETIIFLITPVNAIMNAIKWNAFYPIIDMNPLSEQVRGNHPLSLTISILVEINTILFIIYLIFKLPKATDGLSRSFARVYIFKHRVHESLIGVIWILIGILFISYCGDPFDRTIGILYILFGAFLLGKDYYDVKKFDFIKDLVKKRGNEEDAQSNA
ncbi:MAG: hypothetical protein ACFFCS_16775 [Candidatus Hodarchaeota archaeon]